jgi:hypothetical protein
MTMFLSARQSRSGWHTRSHVLPVLLAGALAAAAMALIAYLLWPTWGIVGSTAPQRLPVIVGGTLFNVPTDAIRMKIQRHSGQQERIDLSFIYPSLDPPAPPKRISAETVEDLLPPIDRMFLSIAAHHDMLAPDIRLRTIYSRYLDQGSKPEDGLRQDGLTIRAFRDSTPYAGEDLIVADAPGLDARCTRDAKTPGMCLSERRVDGADLTFRFPRSWLSRWRDVTDAMDRLTVQLHGSR